jgi:hypothetical protein
VYYAMTRREELLQYFPKGGVGAEIGVAEGTYSAVILENAKPSELHLIDPWSPLEAGSSLLQSQELFTDVERARALKTEFSAPAAHPVGDDKFTKVVERFKNDPRVRLHRQYSYKAVTSFPDEFFDFVYIDGNHHYEFALRDLEDFAVKLKPGGLLFGHDFFEDGFAKKEHYGVVDAVNVFIKRSGFYMVVLTWESFSTFCLARRLDGFAGAFVRNLLEGDTYVLEIPSSLA